MAFERITQRSFAGRRGLPASLSLNCRKKGGRPACVISLQADFVKSTNFTANCRFHVAIGTGVDTGKIQIARATDGIFGVRGIKGGSLLFDLGYIAALGEEPRAKTFTTAVYVDGAVVIDIPEAAASEGDDEEEIEPARAAAQAIKPAKPAVQAPQPARSATGAKTVNYHGVVIDLSPEVESVTFRGRTIEVSTRGAKLIEMLARVMPSCVGDEFIIGKLWFVRPAGVNTLLDMVVRDLGSLKSIGLEVRKQKGVGLQLVETGK